MISIIVPTYNERENVPELVDRIDAALDVDAYEILVVDDDSPDETWRVAEEQTPEHPVRVIRRTEERGLATAVLRGVAETDAEYVVVMDADLQHPPERIPALLSELRDGTDVVVGSRFADGGSVGDFGPLRLAMSKVAEFLARTLFRDVRDVEDIESGFFAFRRDVVAGRDLDPVGYKILLEILVEGEYDSVAEVGYTFQERRAGESKLGVDSVWNYLHHLTSLFYRSGEFHRFLAFAFVGALGAVVNLTTLYALTDVWDVHYLLGGVVAVEMGLLSNFTLNKLWTFRDHPLGDARGVGRALLRDHAVRVGGMTLNLVALWGLTAFFDVFYLVAQAVGIGLGLAWNYTGNKWWTWETS